MLQHSWWKSRWTSQGARSHSPHKYCFRSLCSIMPVKTTLLKLLWLQLTMHGGPTSNTPPMGCYRTMDSAGADIAGADIPHQIGQDLATKMYSTMAALQIVDTVFYEAQRQVRAGSCVSTSKCVVSAGSFALQLSLANAGKILILHDKCRRRSHSCGLCSSPNPGRHCKLHVAMLCSCEENTLKLPREDMIALWSSQCTHCCTALWSS